MVGLNLEHAIADPTVMVLEMEERLGRPQTRRVGESQGDTPVK
jgi:hypothetical protein